MRNSITCWKILLYKTYDDKLYMDDFERMIRFGMLRKNRTELLVLDACQTSKGNDQRILMHQSNIFNTLGRILIAFPSPFFISTTDFYHKKKIAISMQLE
ncbi:hypothetical protein MHK_001127 [Candidatus Magnetomorum sp. HK-1]|nr:hypothetical protein MHK_001127 [Candidatus Magnetomorum sp. HK-1]